jgi:hypothetical protein
MNLLLSQACGLGCHILRETNVRKPTFAVDHDFAFNSGASRIPVI